MEVVALVFSSSSFIEVIAIARDMYVLQFTCLAYDYRILIILVAILNLVCKVLQTLKHLLPFVSSNRHRKAIHIRRLSYHAFRDVQGSNAGEKKQI